MNAELRLKDKFSYNILLRMTENFEEIFQLIKDDRPDCNVQPQLTFYQQGNCKLCL